MADTKYVLFFPGNCPTSNKSKQTKKISVERGCVLPKHMGHLWENRWKTYFHLSTNQFPNNKAALQLRLWLVSFLGFNCCHSGFCCCTGAAVSHITNVRSFQRQILMATAKTDTTRPVFHENMFLMLSDGHFLKALVCVCLCVHVCKWDGLLWEGERREVSRDSTAVQIEECSGLGWVSSMFPAGPGVTVHCTAAGELRILTQKNSFWLWIGDTDNWLLTRLKWRSCITHMERGRVSTTVVFQLISVNLL